MSSITVNTKLFWILWFTKIFKMFASMKFIWLMLLYIPMIYGMLIMGHWTKDGQWISKIPASIGCGLLGGGFVTLALGRIYAKTKLKEGKDEMDTD